MTEYKCIAILCEGKTEASFCKNILSPYLQEFNIYLEIITLNGVSRYSKIQDDLKRLCKNTKKFDFVTTMLDYYGLPSDTPGYNDALPNLYDKIKHIEDSMKQDIGSDHLIPNLIVHEFEALLFSNPEKFSECDFSSKQIKQLLSIKESFHSPEYINNEPATAPSKRILNISKSYQKAPDGILVAKAIGLQKMLDECIHFKEWIDKLKFAAFE